MSRKRRRRKSKKMEINENTIKEEKVQTVIEEELFEPLITLEDKGFFCQKLYNDIVKAYENTDVILIKKILNRVQNYFIYTNNEEQYVDTELINILKKVSGYEIKPIWEKVTNGIGINIYVGLEYKNIVFSLIKD